MRTLTRQDPGIPLRSTSSTASGDGFATPTSMSPGRTVHFRRLHAGIRSMNAVGRPMSSGLQVQYRIGEPVQLIGPRGNGSGPAHHELRHPLLDQLPDQVAHAPAPTGGAGAEAGSRPKRYTGCQARSGRRGPGIPDAQAKVLRVDLSARRGRLLLDAPAQLARLAGPERTARA